MSVPAACPWVVPHRWLIAPFSLMGIRDDKLHSLTMTVSLTELKARFLEDKASTMAQGWAAEEKVTCSG